jgi:hypothetical protein
MRLRFTRRPKVYKFKLSDVFGFTEKTPQIMYQVVFWSYSIRDAGS